MDKLHGKRIKYFKVDAGKKKKKVCPLNECTYFKKRVMQTSLLKESRQSTIFHSCGGGGNSFIASSIGPKLPKVPKCNASQD